MWVLQNENVLILGVRGVLNMLFIFDKCIEAFSMFKKKTLK